MSFPPVLGYKHVGNHAAQTHYFHPGQREFLYQQWFGFPRRYPDEISIPLRWQDAFSHSITQCGNNTLNHFKSRIFISLLNFAMT
jgi:hypothetical protein